MVLNGFRRTACARRFSREHARACLVYWAGRLNHRSDIMDGTFPHQLFPHFYLDGPPDVKPKHCYSGWGTYERVFPVNAEQCDDEGALNRHRFESQHTVRGEEWVQLKPAVTPFTPPHKDAKVYSTDPLDPLDFPEQMKYYYQHHCMDAFSTMGRLLEENFTYKSYQSKDVMSLRWSKDFVKGLNYKRCELGKSSRKVRHIHRLLSDIVTDVPQPLLCSLLHEELTYQSEQQQFSADATGGALGFLPFYESEKGSDGCLIYSSGALMDKICFHRVVQEYKDDGTPTFNMGSEPVVFNLNAAARQISCGNYENSVHVAVRSDYFCGAWFVFDKLKPSLVDVIQTKQRFSCVTVSPHLPGEIVVANEQGAAYLWTPKKGLQKFREEDANLYFNAKSPWRWCDFSCHPRVLVYADRTGAELTDIRSADCNHTLFRIGKTPACLSGERVILVKYLGNIHPHHHLINTQFSSYIMDERVPSIPMLKWDHMMDFPPIYACALPPKSQSQSCKVLLGAQRSQEIMLLQYTGGRQHACQTQGPIQKLLCPKDSLSHLNLQLPHKRRIAQKRLNSPAAGFMALQNKDYLSVFHLTDTADIFYQTLKLQTDQTTTNAQDPEQAVRVEPTVGDNENLQLQTNDNISENDSETEGQQVPLSPLKVIDNVDNDPLNNLDANENVSNEPPNNSTGINLSGSTKPLKQSKYLDLQRIWDVWFDYLFKNSADKKWLPQFRRIYTADIKCLRTNKQDKLEEDRLTRLRKDLQEVMRNRDLLVHGVTYLPHLNVEQIPDPVDPEDWPDDVSQRMAASWEGNWKSWWEDKLGLNRDKKIANLRQKRRREKQARSRSRTSLSGSFASSVSNPDSLSGWSSATSQYLGSDEETLENSQATDIEEWKSRPENRNKSPILLRRFLNEQSVEKEAVISPLRRLEQELMRSSKSQPSLQVKQPTSGTPKATVEKDSVDHPGLVSPLRKLSIPLKRCKEFYLSSLPTSQASTQDSTADGGFSVPQARLLSPAAPSQRASQIRSSSQASQPKKKSRMGF